MLVYDINVLIVIQYLAKYKTMQSHSQKKKKTMQPFFKIKNFLTDSVSERERERIFLLKKRYNTLNVVWKWVGPG